MFSYDSFNNLVLDITAQEEVYRRFMEKLGYTQEEIKNYITGSVYYAWAFMANIYGVGGPISDSWFERRVKLARKNQWKMRRLGMKVVLQGFSGIVPVDIIIPLSDSHKITLHNLDILLYLF